MESFVKRGDKVLLKVNLLSAREPKILRNDRIIALLDTSVINECRSELKSAERALPSRSSLKRFASVGLSTKPSEYLDSHSLTLYSGWLSHIILHNYLICQYTKEFRKQIAKPAKIESN